MDVAELASLPKNLQRLRSLAVTMSLPERADLATTLTEFGFVQYDPLRRPARAQELILFQRVADYRIGDLDRYYPESGFEEDYLYAYGALKPSLASLLHPRSGNGSQDGPYRPAGLADDVLAYVRENGPTHPHELVKVFGRVRATNDWGGTSAATTRALEELHHHGCLRVARRATGVKVYERASPVTPDPPELSARERLHRLTLAIVHTLAPVNETGLKRAVGQLCAHSGGLEGRRTVVGELMETDQIEVDTVDGIRYLRPAVRHRRVRDEIKDEVRFLAPFDPVVWERERFEHLWGWRYRFEAYTPKHKRRFGYYALPMLWRDTMVGWVNLSLTDTRKISVESGFPDTPPRSHAFRRAFDDEVDRVEAMLMPSQDDRPR